MKLTTLIILISIMHVSATVYSQTTRLSLNMQETTIKEVLQKIESLSEFRFIYQNEQVDLNRRANVQFKDERVENILDELFEGEEIEYSITSNNLILIKSRSNQVHRNVLNNEGIQQKTVSGKVTDSKGQPLPGVTVLIKGTIVGTVTDIDGKYRLDNIPDDAILQFSFIGMKTQDVIVDKKNVIDIIMHEESVGIEEVVAIGYGTSSRKNLTTSIASIKTENINKAAISNKSSLLLGRAAGLQATVTSPQPDGKIDVSIRGGGTPLYVVDGIVMPGDALEVGAGSSNLPSSINRSGIGGLNPEDIESIEILKDASASIYGIGAANGVILITTKKGRKGKPTITYTSNYSVMSNQRQIKVLNADRYMRVANAFSKDQYLYNKGMQPYGDNVYDGLWTPVYTREQIENNQIDTNWPDLVIRNGSINNQNLTISGGTEGIQYYCGLNYFNQDATVRNSNMERYVIRNRVSAKLFPFFKLSTTLNYNNNYYTNSTVGTDPSGGHTYGAYAAAISYPPLLQVKENGVYSIFSNIPNPKALEEINDKTETNTVYVNFESDIDLLKDLLSAKLVYGMNKENTNRKLYIPSDVYYNQILRSRGNIGNAVRTQQTMEATINFRKSFAKIVDVDIVAGVGRYLTSYDGSNIYYENTNDLIGNDKIELAEGPYSPSSYKGKNEKRSQFIRGTIDFLDRYILSAAVRRDGADKFFPSQKYALFPSLALAWKISNESFMETLSFVNLLKLRVSYGKTGLDNLGSSLYGLYSPGAFIKFDNGNTQYVPYLLSGRDYDDVSWEKTTMKNIGLDFSIWNNRVWGSIDVYRNDQTDLLSYDNESWLSMYGKRPKNSGHYKRQGIDVSINTKNVEAKGFKWTTLLTLSHNENLWVSRADNYDYQIYQKRKNEPVNNYYYYKHTGIINSERSNMPDSQKSLAAKWQMPGCPIIKDKNKDGVINEEDIYLDNDGDPKLYAGLGNTFYYKNFDLDIFMYGRFGIRKWNRSLSFGDASSLIGLNRNIGLSVFDSYNSLTNPNGNRVGYAAGRTSSLPGGKGADLDVEDASFLRVRNITLGYNFNKAILGNLGTFISSARIFFDVQNPFIFTNFSMIDPEIQTGGGQSSMVAYPQTRTFSCGVKVVF